jgi:hypothetical protein
MQRLSEPNLLLECLWDATCKLQGPPALHFAMLRSPVIRLILPFGASNVFNPAQFAVPNGLYHFWPFD